MLTAGVVQAQGVSAVADRAPWREIDAIVTAFAREHRVPGISVAILRGDALLFAQGFGLADRERDLPASAATVYQTGSIAKQFTAAAVLRLVEQRKLSLDDPLVQWRKDFAHVGPAVQIRHLLQQTSGLPDFFTIGAVTEAMSDITRPQEELLAHIRREPLVFPPGERWSYSNSNYTLLSLIVEQRTGLSYEEFLTREWLQPLGLHSIRPGTPLPGSEREARGYVQRGGAVRPAPPENFAWARGDGGLAASVLDLVHWMSALKSGRIVSAASFRRMVTPDPLNDGTRPDYAFGLSVVPLDGEQRISHGGAMLGFSNTLAYYPRHDVIIGVMMNLGSIWPQALEQAIARALFKMPTPRPGRRLLTTEDIARFSGRFSLGDMMATVERGEQGLRVRLPHGLVYPLLYQGDGMFVAEPWPDAVALRFDPPTRLQLLMAGMTWYGRRVDDPR